MLLAAREVKVDMICRGDLGAEWRRVEKVKVGKELVIIELERHPENIKLELEPDATVQLRGWI